MKKAYEFLSLTIAMAYSSGKNKRIKALKIIWEIWFAI